MSSGLLQFLGFSLSIWLSPCEVFLDLLMGVLGIFSWFYGLSLSFVGVFSLFYGTSLWFWDLLMVFSGLMFFWGLVMGFF